MNHVHFNLETYLRSKSNNFICWSQCLFLKLLPVATLFKDLCTKHASTASLFSVHT